MSKGAIDIFFSIFLDNKSFYSIVDALACGAEMEENYMLYWTDHIPLQNSLVSSMKWCVFPLCKFILLEKFTIIRRSHSL